MYKYAWVRWKLPIEKSSWKPTYIVWDFGSIIRIQFLFIPYFYFRLFLLSPDHQKAPTVKTVTISFFSFNKLFLRFIFFTNGFSIFSLLLYLLICFVKANVVMPRCQVISCFFYLSLHHIQCILQIWTLKTALFSSHLHYIPFQKNSCKKLAIST